MTREAVTGASRPGEPTTRASCKNSGGTSRRTGVIKVCASGDASATGCSKKTEPTTATIDRVRMGLTSVQRDDALVCPMKLCSAGRAKLIRYISAPNSPQRGGGVVVAAADWEEREGEP